MELGHPLATLALLLGVGADHAYSQERPTPERPPIIDMHIHAFSWDHQGNPHMYPQVYADLGAIDWLRPREEFHEYLRALVRAGFGKRLMFGSDQMVWPEGIGMAIEGIESATFLTEEQKRDIFYNNAVRFLRLDEKTLARSSSK